MIFNSDINKQAQDVTFFLETSEVKWSSLTFNGTYVTQSKIQKHLGMFLDSKLDLKEHIKNVLNKQNNSRSQTRQFFFN